MDYPALVVRKDRPLINRHPWIFSGAVFRGLEAPEGAIVAIENAQGRFFGYGWWAPSNPIICRVFAFADAPFLITDDYWRKKLNDALAFRRERGFTTQSAGFRLINAEGDGLPGITIDVYADVAVLQLRIEGARDLRPIILEFLREVGYRFVYEQEENGATWHTEPTSRPVFIENGYRFYADPVSGQKTGFFLDQKDNRALAGAWAEGKTALNAFGYSGGFAVYLLGGGAKSVVSVDISKNACALCDENVGLNFPDAAQGRHETVAADCFEYLKKMEDDRFDLIILDPPAFTKHPSTVERASRGYKELNLKALKKIKTGGYLFTFSCSEPISNDLFRKIIFGAAADAKRNVRVLRALGASCDHPVDIFHPEGEYLKGLVVQVF